MKLAPLATAIIAAWLLVPFSGQAQLSSNMQSMITRIDSGEYGGGLRGGRRGERGGAREWTEDARGYTKLERGDLVRYEIASSNHEVVMSAKEMTPPSLDRALRPIESGSTNKNLLLFATNPRPTMIRKTANDYRVLDKRDHSWHKLGGKTNSGLLYAKLSPDGTHAAYVHGNNIYVETIRGGAIKRLTSDGSENIINGTSDWVNEEEFYIRDAFEWSPDSQRIAFLQFDQSNVPEFTLINYTDSLYPKLTRYHYPKPGQTNSAVRLGVVRAAGGFVRWAKVPGDQRNIYIQRIGWADSSTAICQQMNRLQNTNNIWLVNAKSGKVLLMFQDRDDEWVDVDNVFNNDFKWIGEGGAKELLYTSERDGWRHTYAVSRAGGARLITPGAFDMVAISAIDEQGGWFYNIASPENATQRY